MALIINAEIPAGPTIEEAIEDCVRFAELDTMSDNKFINDLVTELKKMLQPDEDLVDIRLDRKYALFNADITLTGFVRKK